MSVVGLDLSLTATGLACDCGSQTFSCPNARGVARLRILRDDIMLAACVRSANLVVIEGYSMGSHRSHAHALGELGGVVRLALLEHAIPWIDVPPTVLKKFATGKGNAKKDQVLAAAIRAGFTGDTNDEADAWWLYIMGQMAFEPAFGPVLPGMGTQFRRDVIDKIDWPVVR